MKTQLFTLSMLLTFVSMGAIAQKKEKDKVLAGKTYSVEFIEMGSKKGGEPMKDEMTFKSEKLTVKTLAPQHRFTPAGYTVAVDSSDTTPVITFSSVTKNPDGEELTLEGKITDDAIEGTGIVKNKKGKTKVEYTFSGTLKVKAVKKS